MNDDDDDDGDDDLMTGGGGGGEIAPCTNLMIQADAKEK